MLYRYFLHATSSSVPAKYQSVLMYLPIMVFQLTMMFQCSSQLYSDQDDVPVNDNVLVFLPMMMFQPTMMLKCSSQQWYIIQLWCFSRWWCSSCGRSGQFTDKLSESGKVTLVVCNSMVALQLIRWHSKWRVINDFTMTVFKNLKKFY